MVLAVPGSDKKTSLRVYAQHVGSNGFFGCKTFSARAMPISIKTLFLDIGVAVRPQAPFKKADM